MDFFVLKLCWKNIWRNKRRTILTVNAIGFGVAALVGMRAKSVTVITVMQAAASLGSSSAGPRGNA